MKKIILAILIALTACSPDAEIIIETVNITDNQILDGTESIGTGGIYYIDSSVTWTNDRIWIMDGKVVVREGGVLNIEEGTIIKAQNGQGVEATALVIAAGATINALGSFNDPIIFTDVEDRIDYTHGAISPNRKATDTGKWGGIIILGNAVVGEDGGRDDIEGIAAGYSWTAYGGDDDLDSSGTISYVSIRHSGTQLAGGDEIQGLTLAGVGSETELSNIEVVGSNDDGIEIFGGAAVLTNILILNQRDDAIDLDEGYRGTITNAVIAMGSNSDNPFEIDGTEDSTGAITGSFTINDVTVYAHDNPESGKNFLGDWKSSATGLTNNVLYKNIDGLVFKGIDINTYSSEELLFSNINIVTQLPLIDFFTRTTISNYSNWSQTVESVKEQDGADESVFNWTLWGSLK